MKMTVKNLCVELWHKMRLGSITLILWPKCRVCHEAPWLTPPNKFKKVSSAGKVMASIFWDSHGVIMVDYLEGGRTIKGAYYSAELRQLRQKIVKKRRGTLTQGVLLLQDNAPAHTSQVAMATAIKCSFEVLPHPSYSTGLAPLDFCFQIWKLSFVVGILEAMKHHRCCWCIFGGSGRELLFPRDKQTRTVLEQWWGRCIEAKGDIMAQFLLVVIPKIQSLEFFDGPSYIGCPSRFVCSSFLCHWLAMFCHCGSSVYLSVVLIISRVLLSLALKYITMALVNVIWVL